MKVIPQETRFVVTPTGVVNPTSTFCNAVELSQIIFQSLSENRAIKSINVSLLEPEDTYLLESDKSNLSDIEKNAVVSPVEITRCIDYMFNNGADEIKVTRIATKKDGWGIVE